MTLESSKNLGGVGALLIVISFLGLFANGFSAVLALVGVILVLIGMKGLTDHYREAGIFNNALYGLILAIVGVVAFVAMIVATVVEFVGANLANFAQWPAIFQQKFTDLNNVWAFLGGVFASLVVLFIFILVSVIFFRKSLNVLSDKSGVKIFGTAGLLMLIGAILTIIAIGVILIWVGWILVIVGFFSIRTATETQPATTSMQQTGQP
jgi:uncharacterized membrane protein